MTHDDRSSSGSAGGHRGQGSADGHGPFDGGRASDDRRRNPGGQTDAPGGTGRSGSAGHAGAGAPGAMAEQMRRAVRLIQAAAMGADAPAEIATTPKDEIWRDGKVSLHHYRPHVAAPHLGPLLILQGLIGRQTITDLEPERSLVRRLLDCGVDLYVLDWGNPSRAEAGLGMADYALDWLGDALEQVAAHSGKPRTALLGICQGGVFALCHAALRPVRVAGLIPAITPVDFHADKADPDPTHGILNLWARSMPPETLAAWIDSHGVLPGDLTGTVFQLLAPARTIAKYGPDFADLADDPAALSTFLRMERWLADRPDHPGRAAKEWLIELYHHNKLVAGAFHLDGERVDLGRITCPVLALYARDDHIVPAPCAAALAGLTGSGAYEALEVPTGHIGVFVSQKAQSIVAPRILDWLGTLEHGTPPG